MSGIDYLRAMRDGAVGRAPVAMLLGRGMAEVEPGQVAVTLEPGEHQLNPPGTVPAALLATLMDSVMGCAVRSPLAAGAVLKDA